MAEREYTKLTPTRQRRGFAVISSSRSNLWLGKDHLLCIETEGYTEGYKRFYFRDIQAITLRKTDRAVILSAVTGGMTAIFGALTLAMSAIEGRWVFGILAAICAVPFVINLLYGPTCASQLRTAVQSEDIPSLSRVRRARKVIARLRPLIAEAQGQLNEADIPQLMQDLATGALSVANRNAMNDPNAPPVIARNAAVRAPQPARHYQGKSHAILCWLLLADLPLTLPHLFLKAGWLDALAMVFLLATFVVAILAIIQQGSTDLTAQLKALPWVAIGVNAFFLLISIVYGVFLGISNPQAIPQFSPMDDPTTLVMAVVSTGCSVIVGALGLMALRRFRATSPAPSPPPAAGPSAG